MSQTIAMELYEDKEFVNRLAMLLGEGKDREFNRVLLTYLLQRELQIDPAFAAMSFMFAGIAVAIRRMELVK